MVKTGKYLYWLNLVGMTAYVLFCGGRLLMGTETFSGQKGLVVQVAAGLILASLPYLIQRRAHVVLPPLLVALYEIFILMAILLGSGMQAYSIPFWDKIEHIFSAAILAGTGYMLFAAMTSEDHQNQINPLLMCLFAAAFGTMLGVVWEFYEFTGDSLMGMNMQRFMSNGVPLVGQAALYDTMGDLLMDVLGSTGLGIYGYFALRRDQHWLDTFKLRHV